MCFGRRLGSSELFHQFPLPFRQSLRQSSMDLGVEVAATLWVTETRHPLAAKPKDPSILCSGRNCQFELSAIGCRHHGPAAENERRHRDRDLRAEVVAVTLESWV